MDSSCAGLTRASISKNRVKAMDCRVKPGNDERGCVEPTGKCASKAPQRNAVRHRSKTLTLLLLADWPLLGRDLFRNQLVGPLRDLGTPLRRPLPDDLIKALHALCYTSVRSASISGRNVDSAT
jgi:hypothetical protein